MRRFFAHITIPVIAAIAVQTGASEQLAEPDLRGVWLGFALEPPMRLGAGPAPLNDAGKAAVEAFYQQYGGGELPEPGAYCVPAGMPSVMLSLAGYPIEILQSEDRITMLAEMEQQVRRVYLDGRDHPADYPTTRIGHSVGHWEGDSLVIDTALLTEWHYRSFPRSDAARIVERIHLTTQSEINVQRSAFIIQKPIDDVVLVDEMTVTDPKYYTQPQRFKIYFMRVSDDNILEYDCPVDVWRQALERHAEGRD